MGWNPTINFQLRDDQVVVGKLIFDKNGAELLSELFIDMKAGMPVNLDVLNTIVRDWCFTNDEFDNLRVEFDQIKEDISEFKRICNSYGAKWTACVQSVGIAADFIVGTSTWVESYKESKSIAAGLYQQIKRQGYQFDLVKQQEYDLRYSDVMSSATDTELVEAYLAKKYREDMANGDTQALKKYCDALVETGCITKEAAEKKMQMMGYFDAASGNQARADSRAGQAIRDEAEKAKRLEDEERSTKEVVNQNVVLTQSVIKDLWNRIDKIKDDPAAKDTCMDILHNFMCIVYDKSEIPTPFVKRRIYNSGDLWSSASTLYSILTMNCNEGLIDSAECVMPKDSYDKIMHYCAASEKPAENGDAYDSVTVQKLKTWLDLIVNSQNAEAARMFLSALNDICVQVGVDVVYGQYPDNDIAECQNIVAQLSEHEKQFDNAVPVVVRSKVQRWMDLIK